MSKEKQRDEAGQFGGVYGSKNKAVREKATRDLWKKLGIKMPSPGRMVSDQDKRVIKNAAKSGQGGAGGRMISDSDLRILEQIIKEMGPMGTTKKIRKNKMGGGKIKKNYAPGGRTISDKDSAPGGRMISDQDLQVIRKAAKSGEEVSDSDLKLLEKMIKGGFATSVSDLIARIKKKNYTEKQKNKKGRIESDFLKELQKIRQFQTGKKKKGGAESTRRPAPKRQSFEQPNMEEDTTGEVYGAYHKEGKKGGGKTKKNYAKGGSVRPASY